MLCENEKHRKATGVKKKEKKKKHFRCIKKEDLSALAIERRYTYILYEMSCLVFPSIFPRFLFHHQLHYTLYQRIPTLDLKQSYR